MRILFPLLLLVGLAVAFGYDQLAARLAPAEQLGTWRVYDAGGGFRTVDAPVGAESGPVRVVLDLTLPAPTLPSTMGGRPLTVTVASGGRTVLAQAVSFADAELRDDNPQTPERTFRAAVGTIPAGETGPFTLTVAAGDEELPPTAVADLHLFGGGTPFDGRAQPAGFALMAVGFIGTVLAWSRRRRPAVSKEVAPPVAAPEPAPRWGRGASDGR